jgi:hypothetical protein
MSSGTTAALVLAGEMLLARERHQQDRVGRGDGDRHDRTQRLAAEPPIWRPSSPRTFPRYGRRNRKSRRQRDEFPGKDGFAEALGRRLAGGRKLADEVSRDVDPSQSKSDAATTNGCIEFQTSP